MTLFEILLAHCDTDLDDRICTMLLDCFRLLRYFLTFMCKNRMSCILLNTLFSTSDFATYLEGFDAEHI